MLEGRGESTDSALTRTDSGSGSGQLVAVVDVLEANVETLSVLVNEEEELELCDGGPWLGLLLTDMLLPLLLSELDLAC